MTTAEQFRSAVAHPTTREVSVAGVLWPAYKVVALAVGLLVLGLTAAITTTAAHAVLTGAAVSTVLWLVLGIAGRKN